MNFRVNFQWLKRYMPRGLFGRAALILVLPVVTLQLVVSVVFIQRHFEDVSDQMSRVLAREINLVLKDPETARPLELTLREVPPEALPDKSLRRWYDFSGIVVTGTLERFVPGLQRLMLPDDHVVTLFVSRGGTLYEIGFSRRRASAANPHQLLVHLAFFGALMTLIAFLYLRNQLRPITRLAEAAQAFGRGRTVPYSPSGAIEVRAAGSAFLDMRTRIERQIEQRTMMLSGVSHDLRTPLTRLRLGLSMLEDEDREPLERDVEDMQVLIDSFLDFARGDSQEGESEPVDPVDLAKLVVEDAKRAGKSVELGQIEGQGSVMLRPGAMRRALDNLVGNAVRYGTHCRISVALTDKSLRFRIEDDGPGIPAERREEAMRPFVRLDPARNQNRGSGVGLGLAIAADIARIHGGVLRLSESESMGGLRADIVVAR